MIWQARKKDPEFAERFDAALDAATDRLEDAAFARAIHGYDRQVVYQGKRARDINGKPLVVHEHDNALLEMLLKGRRFKQIDVKLGGKKGGGAIPAVVRMIVGDEGV
jgi:hypothetical protein